MEIHFKTALSKEDERELTIKDPTAFAEQKIIALKKYTRKTEETAQAYVELGKVSGAHHNGNIWRAMVNLDTQGHRYHAEATCETLAAAIDKSVKEIEAELRKAKLRSKNMMHRGGKALKSLMRGFSF